jgi:ABC-type polysaccharide/polyol phosphate export permease
MSMLLLVAFTVVRVPWPGLGSVVLAVLLAVAFAVVAASWGFVLALRFRTQSAAPLMQMVIFASVLFTTSYAPQELLTGFLAYAAPVNPVTLVVDAIRAAVVGGAPSFSDVWPALVVLAVLLAGLGALSLRAMAREGR